MLKEDIVGLDWCDRYVNHKRFRTKGFGKSYNFRRGTIFRCEENGMIYKDNKDGTSDQICFFDSENCLVHLIPMIDDNWEERSELQEKIMSKFLNKKSSVECINKCYKALNTDFLSIRYKKIDDENNDDTWSFDRHKFSYASLYDLQHMWSLLKDIK